MKIGILTLPLHTNYGGILQAWALQTVLKNMGHEVELLTIEKKNKSFFSQLYLFAKSFAAFLIKRNKWSKIYWPLNTRNDNVKNRAKTLSFISRYIDKSKPLHDIIEIKNYIKTRQFECYIVGSDQVWRPGYGSRIENFFLDFLGESAVKRIAFAASFGTDKWEFTSEQTLKCSILAKKFTAISVRENTGVDLCRKYLGVDSTCVIDPTMLFTPKDYQLLVEREQVTYSLENKIFSYMLDKSSEKLSAQQKIAKLLKLEVVSIEAEPLLPPYATKEEALSNPPKPVEQWLRSFRDAKFIVTDSFHGTVFSILYHCPFVVMANEGRGMTRIYTLLSEFGLRDRFVTIESLSLNSEWLLNGIDWGKVDNILQKKRKIAEQFLYNALI